MKISDLIVGVIILMALSAGGKILMHRKTPRPELQKIFDKYTAMYDLPKNLLRNIAWTESRYNAKAVSPVGARGIMQFMPATAKEWGVDVTNIDSSVRGAARYMSWLYAQLRTWELAAAAYNGGIGNLKRKKLLVAAMPVETIMYVKAVTTDLA